MSPGARKAAPRTEKGELRGIKSILKPFTIEKRKRIVSRRGREPSLLYFAVKQNQIATVKYLLDECGASVEDACPCLSMAAYNKCHELVKLLLNKGIDINSVGLEQRSALYYACYNGDMSLVEYLVLNGADVNIIDAEGNTPLMASVKYPDICTVLILMGAETDAINHQGKTALMLAVEDESAHDSVYNIVELGAKVEIKNEYGEDAVFLAAQRGFRQVLAYLERHVDIKPGLAKSHQLKSCYAYLQKEDNKAAKFWRKSLKFLDLPITNQAYEINDNGFESKLEHILDHLNSGNRNVIRYLESRFGSHNPYTMRAIALAAACMENLIDSAKVFNLFIEELKSCPHKIYFQLIPFLHNVCTRLLMNVYNHNRGEDAVLLSQQILRSFVNHMKQFCIEYDRLTKAKKYLKAYMIDSSFECCLRLIHTILYSRPDHQTTLQEALKPIIILGLRGTEKNSILHFSIKNGYDMSIIEQLLSCGADVNCRNEKDLTPLHYIVHSTNNTEGQIIEMFLRYGFELKDYNDIDFCLACTFNKRQLLDNPLKNTSLQCLAARAVHLNQDKISHEPRHLCNIVKSHSFKR